MERIYLTWNDVDMLIDKLLPQFTHPFDALLMITRGGIVPGGILAEALDIRYVLTAAVRFPATEGVEKRLAWPTFLQFPEDALLEGRRVLIVDDVWDDGRTIMTVKGRVEQAGALPELAVLHYKPTRSLFPKNKPDYFAAITDKWVVYPWELRRGGEMIRPITPSPLS